MADFREATYSVEGGYEIMVREAGSGPAIVFLHGSGPGASGVSNFRANIDAFISAGYRVVLPDLVGYGASSKPEGIDYTLTLFTDTVYDALRQHGIERATLVGNSLGGGIAIQMTADHPEMVANLVLMAPGCIEDLDVYFAMPGIANMRSSFGSPDFGPADQRRLIESLVHDPVHVTDELVAERYAVARTQSKDVIGRMRTHDVRQHLPGLTMPILLFWGRNEKFMPLSGIDTFFENCPDVRCMIFSGVGHWVQVERASEFNRYAIEFLDEHR
ncbi:alpha/beta fold hydrolase [Parafrankia sp. BMG5.11]|uniref:alpha/beta fold hydrolase n=1 Tax=Parafrankia sp. BMG5.11 TaxID=222540 RepID=UPI001038DE92|nr:alpha/beta fold hydrolase [Parafrankia sp. BMG5.11]TCJ37036.1 alpha/beta fold hydrolase [Parafrankia sp. BMG5.11]